MRRETAEPAGEEQSCDRCGVCRLRIGAGGCARRRQAAADEAVRAEAAACETAEAVVPLRRSA